MRSPAFPPRRPSHLIRYLLPGALLCCLLYYYSQQQVEVPVTYVLPGNNPAHDNFYFPDNGKPPSDAPEQPLVDEKASTIPPTDPGAGHPIDSLIKVAHTQFDEAMAKESHTLEEAAKAYRARRGRHPLPASRPDFWDQIYHDLNPFWGLDARRIRKEAWDYEMTINIRNGNASAESDWFWTQIWLSMIKTIEEYLPDMDIALNPMDEPRLVVPWEDINRYVQKEQETRFMAPPKDVVTDFMPRPKPGTDRRPSTRNKKWESTEPYWLIARRGCHPQSPARMAGTIRSFDKTPAFVPANASPHQYRGYTSNFSLSTEFCHQPDLQGLQGIFIKPLSTSATKVLSPHLAVNNEILLPAPMYWKEEERFTGDGYQGGPWSDKMDGVIWRGVATGGRNKENNWKSFQRHRFVSMNNGTKLARAEADVEAPINFAMPLPEYNLAAQKEAKLGQWVRETTDVAFTELMCDDKLEKNKEWGHCVYTDPYFEIELGQPLSYQFDFKYLPDIDGNSFSGRYLGFLRSTSLPIKSTLFREWHDSRLFAWKHFVPMDARFGDYYGILEYFMGYGDKVKAHDAEAEKIATAGKEWAEKVLRKEDMQVYVLRLLLEYARVSDDRRETMGWVEDLV
ncbi:Beta-1-2-xylosyltransferase 1 [Apiospora arundinis]